MNNIIDTAFSVFFTLIILVILFGVFRDILFEYFPGLESLYKRIVDKILK